MKTIRIIKIVKIKRERQREKKTIQISKDILLIYVGETYKDYYNKWEKTSG